MVIYLLICNIYYLYVQIFVMDFLIYEYYIYVIKNKKIVHHHKKEVLFVKKKMEIELLYDIALYLRGINLNATMIKQQFVVHFL